MANQDDYQIIIADIFEDLIDNSIKKDDYQNYNEHLDKFMDKLFEFC